MQLTNKDKIEIAIWVGALRSGLFKQTRTRLQDKKGHCCLGVACELFTKKPDLNDFGYLTGVMPDEQENNPEWLNLIDEDAYKRNGTSLSRLNDTQKLSFNEIADIIEILYLVD